MSQGTVSIHPHPSIISDQPHFRDACSRVVAVRSAWIRYHHQGFERRKKVPLPLCRLAQPRLYVIPSRSVEIRTNQGTAIPWFVNTTPSTHRIPTKLILEVVQTRNALELSSTVLMMRTFMVMQDHPVKQSSSVRTSIVKQHSSSHTYRDTGQGLTPQICHQTSHHPFQSSCLSSLRVQ